MIAAWFIVMITQAHSTQSVIQIGFATKDEKSAAWGYLFGGLLILPVGFIAAIIGMAAAVSHPGIVAAEALPRVVMDLSPMAAGVILAGLWAADVSTASAMLLGSATLVSSDIVKRFFAPDLTPARDQLLCRITVAVLSVVTLALALTVQGILKTLLVGLTLTTAYTFVVLMTIYWPSVPIPHCRVARYLEYAETHSLPSVQTATEPVDQVEKELYVIYVDESLAASAASLRNDSSNSMTEA